MTNANGIHILENQKQQSIGNAGDWRHLMTSRERYIHMLEHGIRVDCTFVIGPDDGETQEFQAHRLQLSNASAVFDTMLLENVPADTAHVRCRISSLSPRIFQLILSYVYKDEADMETFEEAHELLVAAQKYKMVPLGDACVKYIGDLLKPDNVWESMHVAMMLKNESLLKLNLEVVRLQTTLCLASQAFLHAPEDCLSLMLDQDELNVESEMDLVIAVVRWAQTAAQKQGLNGTNKDVRTLLKPYLLPRLRLLTLTPQQFVNELRVLGDWLTGKEQWAAMKCILNQNCDTLPPNLSKNLAKRNIPKPSDCKSEQEMLLCEPKGCCKSSDGSEYIPCLHTKFEFRVKKDCQLNGVWLASLHKEADQASADTYVTNINIRVVKCGDHLSSDVPTKKTLLYYNNAYKTKVSYNSIIAVTFPGGIPISTSYWYAIEVIFHDGGRYKVFADIPVTSYINGVKFAFNTKQDPKNISKNHQIFKAIIFSN